MMSLSFTTIAVLLFGYVYTVSVFITGSLLFAYDGATTCHSMEMMHVYTIILMVSVALGVSGHFFSKTLERDLNGRGHTNESNGNVTSGVVSVLSLTNLVIGATIISSPQDCSGTLWLLYVRVTWLIQICTIGAFFIAAIGFFLYYFFENNTELLPIPATGGRVQVPSPNHSCCNADGVTVVI